MKLIDSHCHLDDDRFDDCREQVIDPGSRGGCDAHGYSGNYRESLGENQAGLC